MSATEEWFYGAGGGNGTNPYIIVVGGSSAGNTGSWGLLSMSLWTEFITMNGLSDTDNTTGCGATNCDAIKGFGYEMINSTSNYPFFITGNTQPQLTGNLITNHCFTASIGNTGALQANRAAIGGVIGSVNSCVKIAVDGYSLSGAMMIGLLTNNISVMVANSGLETLSELGGAAVHNTHLGKWDADNAALAVNQGSPVACWMDNQGGKEAFWLVSSAEFFQNSAFFAAAISAAVSGTEGAAMDKATYGQLWGFWPFKAADSTSTTIGAIEPDNVIFVGEKAGKGNAFRFSLNGTSMLNETADTTKFVQATVVVANQAVIAAPTGGVGQFKGLT